MSTRPLHPTILLGLLVVSGLQADSVLHDLKLTIPTETPATTATSGFAQAPTTLGTIEIHTHDLTSPIPSTRVDQPVEITVHEEPTSQDSPAVGPLTLGVSLGAGFDRLEGLFPLELQPATTSFLGKDCFSNHGRATHSSALTEFPGAELIASAGHQVFTLSACRNQSGEVRILGSQQVEVWPLAKAELTGYSPDVYYEDVPPLTLALTDLYPLSLTYLRAYPGSPASSPAEAVVIEKSYAIVNDTVVQDRKLVLDDIDPYLKEEGIHTLEIVHETPFGTEVLFRNTINVDRTIILPGSVYIRE